jgi:hypothetical protein
MKRGAAPEARVREIRSLMDLDDGAMSHPARCESQLRKWRLIHKYVHDVPFTTTARLTRAEQWREAANHIRDLRVTDLLDWTLLQAEVADNLARGVQDMRPRKNGPCHALVLEYVRDRKRKALAVYRWALAADEEPA